MPFLQSGIVRIVRDEHRSLPVALFSTRNIVKNSLKIQYIMPGEETADAVTVEYFSSRTWKPDEVTVSVAGSSTDNPSKLRLFGAGYLGYTGPRSFDKWRGADRCHT